MLLLPVAAGEVEDLLQQAGDPINLLQDHIQVFSGTAPGSRLLGQEFCSSGNDIERGADFMGNSRRQHPHGRKPLGAAQHIQILGLGLSPGQRPSMLSRLINLDLLVDIGIKIDRLVEEFIQPTHPQKENREIIGKRLLKRQGHGLAPHDHGP